MKLWLAHPSRLKNQLSNPRSNPWSSRKRFGTPRLFQKIKQKDYQHLIALMSWLNCPTSRPESLSTSSCDSQSQQEKLSERRFRGFHHQILAELEQEDAWHCLQISKRFPYITFTPDNMQVKRKHDKPLYYTGYIRSSKVSRIQVDSESALSIMSRRVMQHLGISSHQLSATQTTIYGFNANATRPMGRSNSDAKLGTWDLR